MHSLCQLCSKRAATTHLTELDQAGARRELHLCPQCIQSLDLRLEAGPPPIETIIAHQSADAATPAPAAPAVEAGGPVCPHCGLEFSEYAGNNLFGCAHDYTAFAGKIDGMLKRYHGTAIHVGRGPLKLARTPADAGDATSPDAPAVNEARRGHGVNLLPKKSDDDDKRAMLETALRRAVQDEAYEEAARLRDQLRRMSGETRPGEAVPGAGSPDEGKPS
jgi:protein arginine kinase activator